MGDHLILPYSAVRGCPGYSRHEAPSILLDGVSIDRETEHGKVVTAQLTRRHDTLADAIESANFALAAADIPRGIRRQAREACEHYFYETLGLEPARDLTGPPSPVESLEPMPEEMFTALENIVSLVVDGEYDELAELSPVPLDVEDLRRRVEDECPEALILPDRSLYGIEAISRSDDPEDPGWSYFLELWTETGPARLHIEGEIEETEGHGLAVTFADILP